MVAKIDSKSDKIIKLLFLIYDLERGGPELRLLDMQRHMPEDFDINICVTSIKTALLSDFQKAGAKIEIVPVKRGYLEIHKAWAIYRRYKKERISTINVFGLKEFFQAACIWLLSGLKIKVVYHAVGTFDHFRIYHRVLFRLLSKTASCILCNSAYVKFQLRDLAIESSKTRVIKNGVDTTLFHKSRHKGELISNLSQKKKYVIIGTIANFREEKNYPFLIKAFSILRKKHPNLRLICVGGGSLLPKIKRMSKKQGLREEIIFTGYSDNIIGYLSLMDFFVLCSERESFPNVLLQAMSMEVPVLTTEVGGCIEIVANGINGMTYPLNNLEAFTVALESMIQNSSLAAKLAKNGRKTIVEKFSLERMIGQYARFYRNLFLP